MQSFQSVLRICFFCVLSAWYLSGCNKRIESNIFVLDEQIVQILRAYIKEENLYNCQNELYIDMIDPQYVVFTVYNRCYDEVNLKNKNPLFITHIDSTPLFVFSGVERFLFHTDTTVLQDSYREMEKTPCIDTVNCHSRFFNIVDSLGHIRVIKHGSFPFIPLPDPLPRPSPIDK